jgi:ABC-type protease/lipase transport system fused ATPase/permease subunit
VIVVSHRPATLAAVDKIMVLRNGVVEMFGDRTGVLSQFNRPAVVQTAPAAGVVGTAATAR